MLFSMMAAELFDRPDGKRISDRFEGLFGGRSWGRGWAGRGASAACVCCRFIEECSPFDGCRFFRVRSARYVMPVESMSTEVRSVGEIILTALRTGERISRGDVLMTSPEVDAQAATAAELFWAIRALMT